jgi:hypothetical protein
MGADSFPKSSRNEQSRPHTENSVEQTIIRSLGSIGEWAQAMTQTRFVLLLGLVAALRAGIAGIGPNYFSVVWDSARHFPTGVSYMNSSVLTNLITKMIIQFHLPQETWWAIGFVVTASMLIGP